MPEDGSRKPGNEGLEALNTAADSVGMVPNVRLKDNIIQAATILVGTLISAVVGFFYGPADERWIGVAAGAVAGLIGFALLSGLVLMILGMVRTAKKL